MSLKFAVDQLLHEPTSIEKVYQQDYLDWKHGFVFDALKNQSYGESFCKKFGIQDNLLRFVFKTPGEVDDYIVRVYVNRR